MNQIRQITDEDYETFIPWWENRKQHPPPKEMLPKLGIVVYREDALLACAWLYMDNSTPVCFMAYQTTNPDNTPKGSLEALEQLEAAILDLAKTFNYGFIMTTVASKGLAHFFKDMGWQENHSELYQMFKEV